MRFALLTGFETCSLPISAVRFARSGLVTRDSGLGTQDSGKANGPQRTPKAQIKSNRGVGSIESPRNETEKQTSSAWMRGPSATTRRKARRASQPNRSEEHTYELQSLMRIS